MQVLNGRREHKSALHIFLGVTFSSALAGRLTRFTHREKLIWKGSSGFRPMRSYEEAVAAASLVTAVGITSRSALLEMAEAEDRPDAASFGQLSRHDEQALLLRAQ